MDVREKLMELLSSVSCNGNGESLGSCPDRKHGLCGEMANLNYCVIQNTANHLIAHGVTVQECKVGDTIATAVRISAAMEAETVDAVEVVHGHWINWGKSGTPTYENYGTCSVCHEDAEICTEHRNYCPNCGAKMDLEVDNHA